MIIILCDIISLLIDYKMEMETKKKTQLPTWKASHQDTFGTFFLETFTIAGKFCLLVTADGRTEGWLFI